MLAGARANRGRRGNQRPRIGMRRRAEYLGRCAFFNDPPEIHDEHALAEMAHHVQVVADEKQRQTQLRAQVRKQIEDLRLHRNIERGDRLVGNDEIRPARKRAGNSDALALSARELVREPLRMGRIKTDQGKQFVHPVLHGCVWTEVVDQNSVGDLRLDRTARVEAGVGILKYYLHPPAQPAHLRARQSFEIQAVHATAG